MKTTRILMVLFSLASYATLTACGANNTQSPDLNATISPQPFQMASFNGLALEIVSGIDDPDSSLLREEKRVLNGENFEKNLYERPFTAGEMTYQPDLDILQAGMASDGEFYYFILNMRGVDEASGTLSGIYGIEFDRTKSGRGDLLVMASNVGNAWSGENVHIYADSNGDVGGPNPLLADEGFKGDGYESEVVLEGAKTAFVSLIPGIPHALQIAVNRDLLDGATEFVWGAWAEKNVINPLKLDYNDHFSAAEAGSPIKDNPNYPLAGLYSVDNTCRQVFGFTPTEYIPGTCIAAQETKKTNFFFCPSDQNFGCCTPPDFDITPTPGDTPSTEGCVPSIPHISAGTCSIEASAQARCDGENNIITIQVPSAGYSASLAGFMCTTNGNTLVCTGAKQSPGIPLAIEVCGPAKQIQVPNCSAFPNTFWSEELGACLTLGSSCCPIGQEWTTDEGKCVPIVSSGVACGGAYTLINGVCVLTSSLAPCCTTITVKAPCCFSSCAPGYVLNPNTLCCDKGPCAGVNCATCCSATGGPGTCPPGCCPCP